jgi:hypothetical protein
MSMHVEWDTASTCEVTMAIPGEDMPDGQNIDSDKWGLMLGGDGGGMLVVEGTPAELLAFAARVTEAVALVGNLAEQGR